MNKQCFILPCLSVAGIHLLGPLEEQPAGHGKQHEVLWTVPAIPWLV